MKRRDLTRVAGAVALLSTLTAVAQVSGRMARVGFLAAGTRPVPFDPALKRLLQNLGYVEGRNIQYEWRFAGLKLERLPALARELVDAKVDVIVAAPHVAVSAASKATPTIPIVFYAVADPVASGFVESLARPGRNVTGLSSFSNEVHGKNVELLRAMFPKLSAMGVLHNRGNPAHQHFLPEVQAAAKGFGIKVFVYEAANDSQITAAFDAMKADRIQAVMALGDQFYVERSPLIAGLARAQRIASVSVNHQLVRAGGLLVYGQDFGAQVRDVARYVDKILKGAKPADLPVEQSIKLTLIVNRKTADAIGWTIPQDILLRADEVIE